MRGMMVRNAKKEYGLSYENLLFVSPENGIMKPRAVDAQMICGCEYVGIPLRTMHKIRKNKTGPHWATDPETQKEPESPFKRAIQALPSMQEMGLEPTRS